jgi:hypothetical protein
LAVLKTKKRKKLKKWKILLLNIGNEIDMICICKYMNG